MLCRLLVVTVAHVPFSLVKMGVLHHPLLEPSVVLPTGGSPFIGDRVGGVCTVRCVEGSSSNTLRKILLKALDLGKRRMHLFPFDS